jgi:hypothetical protein
MSGDKVFVPVLGTYYLNSPNVYLYQIRVHFANLAFYLNIWCTDRAQTSLGTTEGDLYVSRALTAEEDYRDG